MWRFKTTCLKIKVSGVKMGMIITALLIYTFISSTQGAVNWLSPTDGHNETVKEDTSSGTTIVILNATSTDSDASLTYFIVEQDPPEKFGIQSENELYVKAELDYEVKKSHELRLRAWDTAGGDKADVTIFIEVEDVNDEEPKFTSEPSVTLPTDTVVGSIVYVAHADDVDTVGRLVYSIKNGNEDADFVINAATGEISLNKAFNMTIKEKFDLVLEVNDGVFTVEDEVSFFLTDVIWRNPLNNQSISLAEDTARDTDIVTLDASNALLYSVTQNPGGDQFRIRNDKVYLAQSLDYETNSKYTLTLTALASGRSSTIIYIVEVTDVNDNPLEFSPDTATVDISKDTETGTVVFTAEPQDPDTVGPPTFSITGGNTNSDFSINSTTGELILENPLDPSVTATYTITIEATDGVFAATLTLTVTVHTSATITVPTAGNCGDDTVLTCEITGNIISTKWTGLNRTLIINGKPARQEDTNKYSETRGTSSFTLTIHNTDLTDGGDYRCTHLFDDSQWKRLNIECKASTADLSITKGKKVAITVDKLYPSSPALSASFKKENTDVPVPGSSTCSSSTQYPGYYRCVWSSSNSLADGSYTYSIVVTTLTQADPLTGSFKIVSPQTPVVSNTIKLQNGTTVVGKEGQTLTIQCTSIGGYPIQTVAWYKGSISVTNQLASTSTGILQNDGTYTVTLEHAFTPKVSDNMKTLICRSYYPQADSDYSGSETTTVMLYLRLAVQSFSINWNSSQNSVTVDEHDADLQFICIVDKYPASSIKISFNGDVLAEKLNQKSLSFKRPDVACLDAGVYICEAKDEYGYIPSKSITLFVKCSPRPLRQAPSNFTSNLHAPLTLSFDVIAHPEPGPKGFNWYKKSGVGWTPLLGNVDLKIASTGLQSNLTLINVSEEDFGQYKVIALNSIGSYEHQLFVFKNVSETNIQYTDCETCRRESDSSALIVGIILGVVCFFQAICLTYFIIAYRRKCRQERNRFNRPPRTSTHANPAFAPVAKEPGEQRNSDSTSKEGPAVQEYTDLSRYANTDTDTYDEIKRA